MPKVKRIVPNIWFDTEAEEAAEFYCSIFDDSKVINKLDYPESSDNAGTVVTVEWEVDGQRFVGINGGPEFKPNEAISFEIDCETQDEIDYFWEKLTADGGQELPCGWVKDKYGLRWQVTPAKFFTEWAKDPAGLQRVTHEVWQMKKLDLAKLEKAFAGK